MRKQVERCLSNAQQEVLQAIRAAAAANLPTEGLVEIRDLIRREIELIKAPVANSPVQSQASDVAMLQAIAVSDFDCPASHQSYEG